MEISSELESIVQDKMRRNSAIIEQLNEENAVLLATLNHGRCGVGRAVLVEPYDRAYTGETVIAIGLGDTVLARVQSMFSPFPRNLQEVVVNRISIKEGKVKFGFVGKKGTFNARDVSKVVKRAKSSMTRDEPRGLRS